jgi:hypothetical protein
MKLDKKNKGILEAKLERYSIELVAMNLTISCVVDDIPCVFTEEFM